MNSLFDEHKIRPLQSESKLLALIDQLSDNSLYSSDRDRIIESLESRRFAFTVAVQQISRTYVTQLTSHRDGQTIEGHLAANNTSVHIQFPPEVAERVSAFDRNESLLVEGVLNRWVSGLDRLEFWGTTCTHAAAEVPGPATEVETASAGPTDPLITADDDRPTAGADRDTASPSAVAPAETASDNLTTATDEYGDWSPPAAFLERRGTISSQELIEQLADACQVTIVQATAVIDALWDFLIDPGHYDQGRRVLNLPHFGTFHLDLNHNLKTQLKFCSLPCKALCERLAALDPVRPKTEKTQSGESGPLRSALSGEEHPTGDRRLDAPGAERGQDSEPLPWKRQIAIDVYQSTDLNLDRAYRIVWELTATLAAIMAGGQASIRWNKRGEMIPVQGPDGPAYGFRTYSRLSASLPALHPSAQVPSAQVAHDLAEPTSSLRAKPTESSDATRNSAGIAVALLMVLFLCLYAGLISLALASASGFLGSGALFLVGWYELLFTDDAQGSDLCFSGFMLVFFGGISYYACPAAYHATRGLPKLGSWLKDNLRK